MDKTIKKYVPICLKTNGLIHTKLCQSSANSAIAKCSLKKLLAVVLMLSLLLGTLPLPGKVAYAAQQNSYHDPAEHWMSAVNRTNDDV